MSYHSKPFEELDVLDNFLMNAVAADSEVGEAFCRKVLSVLLRRRIGEIRIVTQYTLPAQAPGYRGIRMDVKVEEPRDVFEALPANIYDLEPHLQNDLNLPRHNRFYQAKIDSGHMKQGDNNFSHMPDLYVITILNFDPFGYDYMMYTIANRCIEVGDLNYEDGLKFFYFYTGGSKGGSREIKTMLQYLQHSTAGNATDDATREIHRYVSKVRMLPQIREDYMRFEEFIYYERRDAAKDVTRDYIFDLLEDYGEIPPSLKEKLEAVNDIDLLKKYHKLAARAGSMEAFIAGIQ